MATLSHKNGRGMIQFPKAERGRYTIYLGRISKKDATTVRAHIDHIIASNINGQALPRETAAWLVEIDADLYDKLASAKLVKPRKEIGDAAIAAFLDRYIENRTDLKPSTILNLKQARNQLVEFFGKDRQIPTLTRGDMGDWHRKLKAKYATATLAMHVKKARQFFAEAVDREMIAANPVKGIKAGSMANSDRMEYVPSASIDKVIKSCPDAEWRLIFALARYGGLRTPSETDALLWSDIRWDEGRMTVRSPKTEHHKGGDKREIPIFPELLPYLREAFELSDGAQHAIVKHRGTNPRRMATKIVERAGLTVWGKLFQNLRSSRETDLTAIYPVHVACAWIGNSENVARKHYLQVTDADFERGAAKSAADRTDTYRTVTGHKKENPRKTGAFEESTTPNGSRATRTLLLKNLKMTRKALQKALHRTKRYASRRRATDIANLRAGIHSSRRPSPSPSPSPVRSGPGGETNG